jgi:hypothetical protein
MLLVRGIPIGWSGLTLMWQQYSLNLDLKSWPGVTNVIALVKGSGEALARASLLPILETFNVLTGVYREMTRLRDSRRIQKFLEGFNRL